MRFPQRHEPCMTKLPRRTKDAARFSSTYEHWLGHAAREVLAAASTNRAAKVCALRNLSVHESERIVSCAGNITKQSQKH